MSHGRLLLVPHTHWDREWYRTHEQFRFRLVRLLDRLLDTLEADPAFRHFTLDGQTIAVEDYLEVRSEARLRIERLVREGRLVVGPWYVLPDEWLVSGEALIRNLRLGLAQAERLGGAMRIGYAPDQFGHVGQLPQLFAGFGFDVAVLWRGVGAGLDTTAFDWEAPDGSRVRTVHLVNGYGNGMHLPLEPGALAARLEGEWKAQESRSPIATVLVMVGSDHLEPEPGLPAALDAARPRLGGLALEIGTLAHLAEALRREAPAELPRHRGELRSGLRAPLLEGCASARAPQKRADFLNDRLLTAYCEPLSAWLASLGGDGDAALLDFAWHLALQNHPHDSICGCSIDAVHEQMEPRFARVAELAGAHLDRVTRELAAQVTGGGAEETVLIVWNPGASGDALAEGVVELALGAGAGVPALHAVDAAGRALPLEAEWVDPGDVYAEYALTASVAAGLVRGFPGEFFGNPVCAARRVPEEGREAVEILLGSAAPPGFDWAAAREALAAGLEREGRAPVLFRPRRLPRLRVRLADRFPGCGLRVYALREGAAPAAPALRAEAEDGDARLENEHWRLEVARDGRVCATHLSSGTRIEDALRVVDEGDRGDEYTFDSVPGADPVERPERASVTLLPASAARVGLRIEAGYRVPVALAAGRRARSAETVRLPVRLDLHLARGLDRIDVDLRVENTARDHRLRLLARAPFAARRFEVESAFEVAERPIAPGPEAFGSATPAERPTGASPQRRFASWIGEELALTVANRGCAEVEPIPEALGGAVALTVLRAVGWLSRDDLVVRPMHAGPPLETPGAQVPGAHRLECSLRLHEADDAERVAAAHRYAAPPLAFVGVGAGEGRLRDGDRLLEVDDPALVVSAIEPRPDGSIQVRVLNACATPRRALLRWNGAGAGLRPVDLAGAPAPDGGLPSGAEGRHAVALRGWQLGSFATG